MGENKEFHEKANVLFSLADFKLDKARMCLLSVDDWQVRFELTYGSLLQRFSAWRNQ